MPSLLYSITVDAHDPILLGRFWGAALGTEPADPDDDGDVFVPLDAASPDGPFLLFLWDPEDKHGKNRVHLDLRPDDRDAEVARLEALGATRVDIGQGTPSWVVLADPEGNEFCVLSPTD